LITFDRFAWDDGNRETGLKHGVSIDGIESLFVTPVLIPPNPDPAR